MLITLAPVFGVLAGVVGVVDTVPYVRDIVRGTTRPHRGTGSSGLLAIVVCVSQRADGASSPVGRHPGRADDLHLVLAIRKEGRPERSTGC